MLEDALDYADLAEQFSKQDSTKQGGCCRVSSAKTTHIINSAATAKKDKKNSVLDSRKTYNICKCTTVCIYTPSLACTENSVCSIRVVGLP